MDGDVRGSVSSKERISLRLWVFKFIHYEDAESFGVSVEGYRPNDQTETTLRNWHSTAIEERISSSLLRSRSGSIYELRGCIDKELAHQYGYPAELVSMFTNGFPRNWKHILKKFSDAVRATIPLIKSQNFSTFGRCLTLDGLRESNQTVQLSAGISILTPSLTLPDVTEELESEGKADTFHEAVVQPVTKLQPSAILADDTDVVNSAKDMGSNKTNFGGQDTSRRNTAGGSVVSVSKFVQYEPASVLSSNLSIHHHAEDPIVTIGTVSYICQLTNLKSGSLGRGSNNDVIELSEWSIRFAPIGYSDPALGFPAFVVLGSKEGHPTQWQTSIVTRVESAQIFHTMSTKYCLIGEMNAVDSASFPKMFVSKFLRGFPRDWRTTITELYNSFFSHLERTARSTSRLEHGSRAKSSYPERNLRSPRGNGSTIESHTSDTSPEIFSKETGTDVRRSRSGRCVHAPLAQWAGQRIRYDGLGNVIGSDLCNYYGMSSNGDTAKRSGSAAKVRKASGNCYSEKPPRKQAFGTSNASTYDVKANCGKTVALSHGDRRAIESRALHVVQDESDDSSFEQKLRLKRRLILNKARELQKQQEELLDLERRIANEEKKCRRNWTTGKRLVSRIEERRVNQRKLGKRLLYNVDDRNEVFWEDDEERKCFEEEWARENMELCTESDDSEDEWSERVQKKRKIPAKRKKKRLPSSGVSSVNDEISDGGNEKDPAVDGGEESCVKFPIRKERRWHKAELQRLKLVLAAIHVCNEDDWEKVSRSLGGGRDPESCKEAAIKRLKWKPTYPSSSPVPEITSEFVTARAGTIAHHHQTNEYTRKFMMGGSVQGEDYFNQNTTAMSNLQSIPDVTEFDADDSLLEVIITPEEGVDKMKRTIRRQFFAEPVDDDTPPRRQSSGIHRVTPTDSAQRERQARYCHHILSKGGRGKGISRMNFSHTDGLTCLERTRDEERSRNVHTFGDLQENLEKVAKLTQNVARRTVDCNGSSFHSDLEGSDFDDNLEDSL
uniref:SANTA domain-containing protein n=1 Tax=Angiostrongylus cantonensis TaxID=6313 RepID=A0A0K0DHL1_ANGCA